VLRFVAGKYEGQEFPLEGKSYLAGRSTEVDLVLADDAVSRKHARFYQARGRYWVRDLGSRNGTVINGEAVQHAMLRAGDRLAIGSSLARIEVLDKGAVSTKRAGESRKGVVEATAGRSMTGSLEDIPLMDVLQWLATSRKTGALKVTDPHRERVGSLHLREGQVYYATITGSETLHPEKALLRMLLWTRGSFDLENTALDTVDQEINMSLEHMLMEAARQEDELKNISKRSKLPEAGDVVEIVKPSPVAWSTLDEKELGMLQLLFEKGDWFDILDTSTQDDVSLVRLLVALQKKGVVSY
jgi:hypothetical protein